MDDFKLNYAKPKICKHCGRKDYNHRAVDKGCPVGSKTRVGYVTFSKTQFFEEKVTRKYTKKSK